MTTNREKPNARAIFSSALVLDRKQDPGVAAQQTSFQLSIWCQLCCTRDELHLRTAQTVSPNNARLVRKLMRNFGSNNWNQITVSSCPL